MSGSNRYIQEIKRLRRKTFQTHKKACNDTKISGWLRTLEEVPVILALAADKADSQLAML